MSAVDAASDAGSEQTHARAPSRRRRRRVAIGIAAGLALLAASVLAGPPDEGQPLDPRSSGPGGLLALVRLAEGFDVHIDISSNQPSDETTHVWIGDDRLDPEVRDGILRWVEEGGRLVVADPGSALHELGTTGQPVTDMVGPSARQPDCDLQAVAAVASVRHAAWTALEVPDDGTGCFGTGQGAWLVAQPLGEGSLIALGSAGPFVNRALDRDDNAVLAAALLFPDREARLQIVPPDPPATAEVGIYDLLPPRVWQVLIVLSVAVLVGLVAVGRRLGRPVEERLPPTVPSAELARSIGDLLQRAGSRAGAAERLRTHTRRELARVLGAPVDADLLTAQARQRLGVDATTARLALGEDRVDDDDALVAVAAATARLRAHLDAPS